MDSQKRKRQDTSSWSFTQSNGWYTIRVSLGRATKLAGKSHRKTIEDWSIQSRKSHNELKNSNKGKTIRQTSGQTGT